MRNVYISPLYGDDTNSGLVNTYPLKTMTRAIELFNDDLSVDTIINLACGETIRDVSGTWTPDGGPLLRFQPWERTEGDLDRLGRPIISGGTYVTLWSQYSANLWYTEQITLPLVSAKAADGFTPDFPYGFHVRGVMMVNGEVFRRRDGLRNKVGAAATGNPFYTGTFNPDTDTLNTNEWAVDIQNVDYTTGVGTQRMWIGVDPTDLAIEVSTSSTPMAISRPINLELVNIEMRCSHNNIITLGNQTGINRRVLVDGCRVIGSGNNGISIAGGNVVCIRNTEILHCYNNNLTHNTGDVSVLLIEDCVAENYPEWGTLPNGLGYDDRCTNDGFVLHGNGGSELTLRRLKARYTQENCIDVLDNYQNVLIEECELSGAGLNVLVTNSQATIRRCKFYDSARGLAFTFHMAASAGTSGYPYNLQSTARGSIVDQCIIVNCGDPTFGDPSGASGIDVNGAAGTLPIIVSRTKIVGSAASDVPVVTVRSKRETRATDGTITTGTWYEPCPLHLINGTTIDHAGGDNRLVAIQPPAANSPPALSESIVVCTDVIFATDTPTATYNLNGTSKAIAVLAHRFGNKRNTIAAISYYIDNPTAPEEVINPLLPIEVQTGPGQAKRMHIISGQTDDTPGPDVPVPPPPPTTPVVADFGARIVKGTVPLEVPFLDISTGTPAPSTWAWDFTNNGSTDSTSQNPTVTYSTAGLYDVKLTVGNGTTTDTITKTGFIEAIAPAPPPDRPPPPPPPPPVPSMLHPTLGKWILQARAEWPLNNQWYGTNITTPKGDLGNNLRMETESAFNSGGIWLQPIGTYTGNTTSLVQNGNTYISRVNDPLDTRTDPNAIKRKVFRFQVNRYHSGTVDNKSGANRFRSEIAQATTVKRAEWGEERWECAAFMFDQSHESISEGDGYIVYQYHAASDADVENPPFSVRIKGKAGGGCELYAQLYKSSYPTTPIVRQDAAAEVVLSTVPINTWIYIVTNYLTGYNPAGHGTGVPFFKMWCATGETDNLTSIINYPGAWSYPGGVTDRSHFTKYGIYYQASTALWSGTGSLTTQRHVFHKEFGVFRTIDVPGISKEAVLASLRNNTYLTTPPPPPPPDPVWTEIAKEWGTFTINPGPRTVRFGTGSSWVEKSVTGQGGCDYVFFGSDPAVGQSKVCQVYQTDVSTPPPPPSGVDAWRQPPSWADWTGNAPILTEMGTLRPSPQITINQNPTTTRIIENLDFTVPNGPGIIIGNGVWNVIIRNCRFKGCAVDSRDINHAAIIIGGQALGGILRVENCLFEDNANGVVWNGDVFRPSTIPQGQCRRAIWVRANHFIRQRVSYWGGTRHPLVPNRTSGGWIKGQSINFTRGVGYVSGIGVCRAAGNVIDNHYDANMVGNLPGRFNYVEPLNTQNYWGGPMFAGPYRRGSSDQISVFECSGGNSSNYLEIDSNVIRGGGYFDGTGIIVGDSVGATTSYVRVRRNRIYRAQNNCIQIAGGYGHVVTGNFCDSAGTAVEDLTHVAISVRVYDGKPNPGGHSVTNNHVISKLWNYNNRGADHPGLSITSSIPNVTQSGNTTYSTILGARVFTDPWGSWST